MTYQRIVELSPEEDVEQGIAVSRQEINGPRAEDVTEDELKLCFHRVTLYLEQSRVYSQSQTVAKYGSVNKIQITETFARKQGEKRMFRIASVRTNLNNQTEYQLTERDDDATMLHMNGKWFAERGLAVSTLDEFSTNAEWDQLGLRRRNLVIR